MKYNIPRGLYRLAANPRFWVCSPWYLVAYSLAFVLFLVLCLGWVFEELALLTQKIESAFNLIGKKVLRSEQVIKWVDAGFKFK